MSQRTGKAVHRPQGRHVPHRARFLLFVHAGGRCEFDGCNRYLLRHHLTKTEGVFAQMAHIYAFSERGPRGRRRDGEDIHAVRDLMLLCPECHTLVDARPDEYTAAVLRAHKRAHEDRVFMLTGTKPDRFTSDDEDDVFLHQATGEKERLKTSAARFHPQSPARRWGPWAREGCRKFVKRRGNREEYHHPARRMTR